MSEIIKQFGQATVILFNSPFESELPSKSAVRKLLGSGQVKYYGRNGLFQRDIINLLCAHDVSVGTQSLEYWRSSETPCTHAFVTNHQVKFNAFAGLTYGAQLVAGFNLAGNCMEELDRLLDQRRQAVGIRRCAKDWLSTARHNINILVGTGYPDPSVSGVDLAMFEYLAGNYGSSALAAVESDINSWVSQYTWAG